MRKRLLGGVVVGTALLVAVISYCARASSWATKDIDAENNWVKAAPAKPAVIKVVTRRVMPESGGTFLSLADEKIVFSIPTKFHGLLIFDLGDQTTFVGLGEKHGSPRGRDLGVAATLY